MAQEWWRPCIAEFIGVFALVYIGAGSIVMTSYMGWAAQGAPTLLVIALAHGLAIAVMVTAVGHISGGHFNPAVTVAALFTKKIELDLGMLYILFQLLGGVFGAGLLVVSLDTVAWEPVALGTPALGNVTAAQGVFIEAALTFFLVFVIFGAGIDPNNRNGFKAAGGLAIGLTVTMDILMGGPLTGAAMNPARAFGPALVARAWDDQLIYWAGPLIGGILAGLLYDSAFLSRADGAEPPEPPEPVAAEGARPSPPGPAGGASQTWEPGPDTTPGGHDPTSLDDPRSR
jgi:aquaporin Z